MKTIRRTIALAAVTAALAVPTLALAQSIGSTSVTCTDYLTMGASGRSHLVRAVLVATTHRAIKIEVNELASAVSQTTTSCENNPGMTVNRARLQPDTLTN